MIYKEGFSSILECNVRVQHRYHTMEKYDAFILIVSFAATNLRQRARRSPKNPNQSLGKF